MIPLSWFWGLFFKRPFMDIHKLINCASKKGFWTPNKESQVRIAVVSNSESGSSTEQWINKRESATEKSNLAPVVDDQRYYCCIVGHEQYHRRMVGQLSISTKSLLDQVKDLKHKDLDPSSDKTKTKQIFISRWHAFAISSLDGNTSMLLPCPKHPSYVRKWPAQRVSLTPLSNFFSISHQQWNILSVNNDGWKFKNGKIILAVNYDRCRDTYFGSSFPAFSKTNPLLPVLQQRE